MDGWQVTTLSAQANLPHLPFSLSRFIRTGFVSGRALPSTVRFTDCQLRVFASSRVMTLAGRRPPRSRRF
jgi:hypothetical protein